MTDFYVYVDGLSQCQDCGDYDGTAEAHARAVHGDEIGIYQRVDENLGELSNDMTESL